LEFVQTLCAATSEAQLGRRFATGFGRLFQLPGYGLYLVDPWTDGQVNVQAAGVSDSFMARYERVGREVDVLQDHVVATGRAAYNLAVVGSMEQWLTCPLYTKVKYLHDIRQEVQAPVVNRHGLVGTLIGATHDPDRAFTPYEVRLMEALGRVVGAVLEKTGSIAGLARQRDQAFVALDRAGSAVVITDPGASEPQINDAGRRLLGEVVDAEQVLHRMLAHPTAEGSFAHHLDVELIDGNTALLRGSSGYTQSGDRTLITVLELQRDRSEISAGTLIALTPRERDVARYVVDGLSDREIAQRLFLSPYTISQYVKRIYRKLDVSSRVALTRLLLGAAKFSRD
jgi:DNA-binding NarL/FixJ family response regulator